MPQDSSHSLYDFLPRLERLLDKLERVLDRTLAGRTDGADVFAAWVAFRWVRRDGRGWLEAIVHPDLARLDDLIGLDRELAILIRNTEQFVRGLPANNVLIWGERGTGKSSTVKGLLTRFASEGLRMIEVHKHDLTDLPLIVEPLWERPERFILFCDDLSFDEGESLYKELKAMLEGGLAARPENVLIYATSNRRHLMPERFRDSRPVFSDEDDEVHPQEGAEEKVSLSDRFGLSIGFYGIDQETYLRIVAHWAARRGLRVARPIPSGARRSSGRSGRAGGRDGPPGSSWTTWRDGWGWRGKNKKRAKRG